MDLAALSKGKVSFNRGEGLAFVGAGEIKERLATTTLQGINISHLGKRNIIFKMPFFGDMLIPWRVLFN